MTTKTYEIRTDANGRFGAFVVQQTATAAGVERDVLAARWFNTRRAAEKFLAKAAA